jgi:hypothetical protein
VGLLVSYFGWYNGLELQLEEPMTLAGYTTIFRFFPIVLITVSVAVFSVTGAALVGRANSGCFSRKHSLIDANSKSPLIHPESTDVEAAGHGTANVTVKQGRPNLVELVASSMNLGAQDVVVAACGPDSMVEGARAAVAAALSRSRKTPLRVCDLPAHHHGGDSAM